MKTSKLIYPFIMLALLVFTACEEEDPDDGLSLGGGGEVMCQNGFMDGNETGIDCDADTASVCPPCAFCGDGLLSTVYFADDTSGMYELDIDCGTPQCGNCPFELVVEAIGEIGATEPFRDQYSYNKIQAAAGLDTLELNYNQYPGLKVEKLVGNFAGPAHLVVTANQGVMTADNGIFMRTVVLYIPWPENVVTAPMPYEGTPAMNVDMVDSSPLTSGSCTPPITGQERPFIMYGERFLDNPALLNRCFFSYVDDGQSSVLSIDYLNGYIQAEYYVKGSINEGALKYEPIPLPGVLDVEGSFTGLAFKVQYPFIL